MRKYKRDLEERTYQFALKIIRLVSKLPRNKVADIIRGQLLRAGTSVGANYEEADGALTRKEYFYFVSVARREAKESNYWLRLLRDSKIGPKDEIVPLIVESKELTKIFSSIVLKSKK